MRHIGNLILRTPPLGQTTGNSKAPPPEYPEPKTAKKRMSFGLNDVRNISVAQPEEAEWSPGTDIGIHSEGACKNFTRHQAREAKKRREEPESSD